MVAFLAVILVVLGVLFGMGLMKLKEKVSYSKAAGILFIAGSASLIVGVGALALLAGFVLSVILLFKEAGKKE